MSKLMISRENFCIHFFQKWLHLFISYYLIAFCFISRIALVYSHLGYRVIFLLLELYFLNQAARDQHLFSFSMSNRHLAFCTSSVKKKRWWHSGIGIIWSAEFDPQSLYEKKCFQITNSIKHLGGRIWHNVLWGKGRYLQINEEELQE